MQMQCCDLLRSAATSQSSSRFCSMVLRFLIAIAAFAADAMQKYCSSCIMYTNIADFFSCLSAGKSFLQRCSTSRIMYAIIVLACIAIVSAAAVPQYCILASSLQILQYLHEMPFCSPSLPICIIFSSSARAGICFTLLSINPQSFAKYRCSDYFYVLQFYLLWNPTPVSEDVWCLPGCVQL